MAELGLYPGTPITIDRIRRTRYMEEKYLGRIETADASQLRIILPVPLLHLLPLTVGDDVQLKASMPEGMYRFADIRTFCYCIRFEQIDEQLKRQIASHIRDHERAQLGMMTEAEAPTLLK